MTNGFRLDPQGFHLAAHNCHRDENLLVVDGVNEDLDLVVGQTSLIDFVASYFQRPSRTWRHRGT